MLHPLNSGDGENLFLIETPGGDCPRTAYDPAFEQKMPRANEINSRYRNALRELAK